MRDSFFYEIYRFFHWFFSFVYGLQKKPWLFSYSMNYKIFTLGLVYFCIGLCGWFLHGLTRGSDLKLILTFCAIYVSNNVLYTLQFIDFAPGPIFVVLFLCSKLCCVITELFLGFHFWKKPSDDYMLLEKSYQIYYSDCDKQKYTLLDMSHLYLWRIFPPHGKKAPNIFLSQFIIEGSGRNVLHMWATPQDLTF